MIIITIINMIIINRSNSDIDSNHKNNINYSESI